VHGDLLDHVRIENLVGVERISELIAYGSRPAPRPEATTAAGLLTASMAQPYQLIRLLEQDLYARAA
jgi:hypothetical protein